MNRDGLEEVLRVARIEAERPHFAGRPWPVVMLSMLSAWLVALPTIGLVCLIFLPLNSTQVEPACYMIGAVFLVAAVMTLQQKSLPIFTEQICLPGILAGGAFLGYAVFKDAPWAGACCVMAVLACIVAWLIESDWMRVLLGGFVACMAASAWSPIFSYGELPFSGPDMWLALQVNVAIWWLISWIQKHVLTDTESADAAARVETMLNGALLFTIAGLGAWSGWSFMAPGSGAGSVLESTEPFAYALASPRWHGLASSLLAVAAAATLMSEWPNTRRWWWAGTACTLAALAWITPTLGALLLLLSSCAIDRRWRLSTAAAVGAVWVIGSTYYHTDLPLLIKGAIFIAAGAMFIICSRIAMRNVPVSETLPPVAMPGPVRDTEAGRRRSRGYIVLCALLVLAASNAAIWRNEYMIANAVTAYVELAPRDPRSLIQGDYMALNIAIPRDLLADTQSEIEDTALLVVRIDKRGVARFDRLWQSTKLAPNEYLIEVSLQRGRWALVNNAWYFKEGEGKRWAGARYGEYRISDSGRALLVGLRGPNLEPL